jgi:RimJ/RimL family protein N-acetyltransferase
MDYIETSRLVLRRPVAEDVHALAEMNADPEVMKYIGEGHVRTFQQTAAGIQRAIGEWDEHEYGLFSMNRRDTGDYIGWVTLAEPAFLPEVLPAVEIGWRLARRHWGHGFATEGAREVLCFGFESCGLGKIVSIRHIENDASRRVMEKLGLHFDFETTVPAHGQPVAVHSITRGEFDRL